MNYFVYMKSRGFQYFLTEDDNWLRTSNVVMPGTPRDPFNPPGVVKVFRSEDDANRRIEREVSDITTNSPELKRTFHVYAAKKDIDVFAILRRGL